MLFNNFTLHTLPATIVGVVLALTVHEWAHGYAAYRLGDPTAKQMGRLTLHPKAHLDLFGALAFVFVGFGWAKPVPVDPRYFDDPRKGMMWVALAGPASNLILAIATALAYELIGNFGHPNEGTIAGAVLNTIYMVATALFRYNVLLMAFNLIPVPPLDGSKIAAGILPWQWAEKIRSLEQYGMMPIIIVLFVLPWITNGTINPVRWIMSTAIWVISAILSPIIG
jgi:Zn-dependent protease